MAVDDIIDRYVAGEFTGDELQRVQNYFLKSGARQEKLRFALALKEQKSRRTLKAKRDRRPLARYLAVAASVLVVIGVGVLAWRALRPQPDIRDGLVALQQAYREERPVEGRISDFNYVPLPNQRGGSARVDYAERDLAGALLLKALRDHPTAAAHHAAAKYYLMNHQFPEAEKEFTAAVELDPQNAKVHNDFGAALLEEGLRQSSETNGKQLELYGRSLKEIQKAIELDGSLWEALFNRALVFQLMKPSDQAREAWQEYLKKDSNSPWADEARRNLKRLDDGQQRVTARQPTDNLKTFLHALHNADDNAAQTVLSTTYTSAGNEITNYLIDSYFGIEPFREALDPPATLAALTYVARLESEHSGDQFTSDLVTRYSRAAPKIRATLAEARYHMRAAYSRFENTRFREAINEYLKAKVAYQQAEDSVGQAFVEYRLAHCYVLLPDPQRARLAYKQLLIVCEASKYRWLAAQCLFGLAHANADTSEYSTALEYSSQALSKFEEIGDINGILKCLTQLADFNQAVNQIGAALSYLTRTLTLMDHASSEPKERWGMLNQIGFSMTSLQLHAAALFYQKEALRVAIEAGNPLIISRSYGYVGSAYAALQMYGDAASQVTHAFDISRTITGTRGLEATANAAQQLGDIYRAAGECDQAVANYDRSLQLYRKLNIDFYAYFAHKGKLQCFIAVADKPAVQDELRAVLGFSESYRSKITVESQRNSFFDAEHDVYDLAIGYESGVENNYVKALEYSEQSRARSLLDAVDRSARMRSKSNHALRSRRIASRALPVATIQQRMPDAQILQYVVLEDRLLVWLITKTAVQYKQVPVRAAKLADQVNALVEQVNHQPTNAYQREPGAELFDLLIKPVEDHLDKSKLVIIVPDKILNYLPYAALTSSATANYLIEDYDLAVAPSATLFVDLSTTTTPAIGEKEHLLSIGDPLFSREHFPSLRGLPATLSESRAVAESYPDHLVLVREEATESAVRREIEKADVVHLATHFVLNEQSEMLSGFPLTPENQEGKSETSDGFLQSFEIAQLNLRRTRLAVLSACQTGIEKHYRGEGAVGAARPFFMAGVPTVVASLWAVDSDASAELMVSFHRHLREGLSAAQALRRAQVEMIKAGDTYRHPYYWAPFLAIGGVAHN